MSRLVAADSMLLVVDVQDKLLAAIPEAGALVRDITFLAKAAKLLAVPVIGTEQYPKGLGPTAADVLPLLSQPPLAKMAFSCLGSEPFADLLTTLTARQVVVVGIEAHVCVLQTVLDLIAAGREVFLPADAVRSRRPTDRETALRRCERAGAVLTTVETVAFEWLRGADHPSFKAVSQLVKDRPI